jgi:hypothetical protein
MKGVSVGVQMERRGEGNGGSLLEGIVRDFGIRAVVVEAREEGGDLQRAVFTGDPGGSGVLRTSCGNIELALREEPAETGVDLILSARRQASGRLDRFSVFLETPAESLPGSRLHPLPFRVGLDGRDRTVAVDHAPSFEDFAEGWILEDGQRGLLVMRVPDGSHKTCFVPAEIAVQNGEKVIRPGIVAADGEDHRTRSLFVRRLEKGETVQFPLLRLASFPGGWEEGVALFRDILSGRLTRLREPRRVSPVSYNTYHDFGPSLSRAKLEPLMPLLRDTGFGLLHLDPGWETFWGSAVWNEAEMGPVDDFVKLAGSYGLKVGCWTTLHTQNTELQDGRYCRDASGEKFVAEDFGEVKLWGVCPCGPWSQEFVRNMRALANAGFVFINSDFHDWPWWEQSCHDPSHGHPVPLSREEWALAVNRAFEEIRAGHPDLVIEMHDHVESGEYRTPAWYLFDRPESYDEKWAYEFMWKTHRDLMEGRLFSLYHLRKAEPVPLFLHMNMSTDNANAIAFWYVASCVTHVGVGGLLKAPEDVREGYRRAIATYNRYFDEFTRGEFVGIDELTHLHTAPDGKRGVLLCFNLTREPAGRTVLAPVPEGTKQARLEDGAPLEISGGKVRVDVETRPEDVSIIGLVFDR